MEKICLRAARVNAGLEVTKAAEALGVKRQTINGWELNSTRLNFEKLMQLSELYHVPYNELFIGLEQDYHEQLRAGNGFNDSLYQLLRKQMKHNARIHAELIRDGGDADEIRRLSAETTELANIMSQMVMED